jgi:hypothetical protein
VNRYGLDDRGSVPGRAGLFATASRPALGTIQPLTNWYQVLFSGVERPGREANYSPSSSAEVKNALSYISTPKRLHGGVLNYAPVATLHDSFPWLVSVDLEKCICNTKYKISVILFQIDLPLGSVSRGFKLRKNILRMCENRVLRRIFQDRKMKCMNWIHMAQDRDRFRAVVNTVMNLPVL